MLQPIILQNYCQKRYENERIYTEIGSASLASPPPPPGSTTGLIISQDIAHKEVCVYIKHDFPSHLCGFF